MCSFSDLYHSLVHCCCSDFTLPAVLTVEHPFMVDVWFSVCCAKPWVLISCLLMNGERVFATLPLVTCTYAHVHICSYAYAETHKHSFSSVKQRCWNEAIAVMHTHIDNNDQGELDYIILLSIRIWSNVFNSVLSQFNILKVVLAICDLPAFWPFYLYFNANLDIVIFRKYSFSDFLGFFCHLLTYCSIFWITLASIFCWG